jgi:hypothetical protein
MNAGATANDVNMLVATGGRQRSEAGFRTLFSAAGIAVIEGAPRSGKDHSRSQPGNSASQ